MTSSRRAPAPQGARRPPPTTTEERLDRRIARCQKRRRRCCRGSTAWRASRSARGGSTSRRRRSTCATTSRPSRSRRPCSAWRTTDLALEQHARRHRTTASRGFPRRSAGCAGCACRRRELALMSVPAEIAQLARLEPLRLSGNLLSAPYPTSPRCCRVRGRALARALLPQGARARGQPALRAAARARARALAPSARPRQQRHRRAALARRRAQAAAALPRLARPLAQQPGHGAARGPPDQPAAAASRAPARRQSVLRGPGGAASTKAAASARRGPREHRARRAPPAELGNEMEGFSGDALKSDASRARGTPRLHVFRVLCFRGSISRSTRALANAHQESTRVPLPCPGRREDARGFGAGVAAGRLADEKRARRGQARDEPSILRARGAVWIVRSLSSLKNVGVASSGQIGGRPRAQVDKDRSPERLDHAAR